MAAASDGLGRAVEQRRLRRDLFQRLAGVVINLPPLADRMEDVLPLAEYFATLRGQRLETGADSVLLNYSWPGNVRELRFAIDRAGLAVANGSVPAAAVAEAIDLGTACLNGSPGGINPDTEAGQPLIAACAAHGWHAGKTATALGIARSTLYVRLQRLGISLRETKRAGIVRRLSEQS